MESVVQVNLSHALRRRGRSRSRGLRAAMAAAGAMLLTTGAMALPPLYPAGSAQGAATNTRDAADCNARPAQLGAMPSAAPITGAGTAGLYGPTATRAATVASARVRPSTFGNGYVGAAGVPYAGGAFAGAPGFGRFGAGAMGTPEVMPSQPSQPSQRSQRLLALEPGQQPPSSAAQSNCVAGHANAVR